VAAQGPKIVELIFIERKRQEGNLWFAQDALAEDCVSDAAADDPIEERAAFFVRPLGNDAQPDPSSI
jgi:hypothetical protein